MTYPLVLDLAAEKSPVAVTCRVLGDRLNPPYSIPPGDTSAFATDHYQPASLTQPRSQNPQDRAGG
jgi:hypothetical protein